MTQYEVKKFLNNIDNILEKKITQPWNLELTFQI